MTTWQPIKFDRVTARTQLGELGGYLNANPRLAEGAVRAFIRDRHQIVASLGLLNAAVDAADRWAPELDLMGKHACDLVVGDSQRCAYSLVEFEDANPESIYESVPATPYFTNRFNHGYSQIVDLLCLLDGTQDTPEFRDYWGYATPPQFIGVLVIGRSPLPPMETRRMDWRSAKVKVNSHALLCMTYDELVARLVRKVGIYAGVSDERPD
jgi:hypothetical protein